MMEDADKNGYTYSGEPLTLEDFKELCKKLDSHKRVDPMEGFWETVEQIAALPEDTGSYIIGKSGMVMSPVTARQFVEAMNEYIESYKHK